MELNGGSLDTHFPTITDRSNTKTYTAPNGFTISTLKLPILKARPIETMTAKLGITPPEMIFGDNHVTISHASSKWSISFNAFDALDQVDKTGESMLKVAYSGEWHRSREGQTEKIKEVVKPFDWSYTTVYRGTLGPDSPKFEPTEDAQIPVHLLTRPDPIRFYDDVMLYEDELADNGITMLNVKIRVMPARLLLLSRFFMRLDNVLVRLRDTRIYVDFEKQEVIREYCAKEDGYERLRGILASQREDVPSTMRDPGKLSEVMRTVEKVLERVLLK